MKLIARSAFLGVLLFSLPAHAGMFSGIGSLVRAIYDSFVEDLAMPVTIAAIAWTLIASMLRLGGAAMAIGTAIVGVVVCQLGNIWEMAMSYVR